MHKIIYISFLLLSFLSAAQAQKKFVYEDTALLQKVEQVTAPGEEVKVDDNTGEDENTDTSLYKNNLNLPYDSIRNWRNLKEYGYTQYLDSLLKNKKKTEAEEASPASDPGIFNNILGSSFIRVLLWFLVIAFVLFIIYRLFLADGVFKRNTKARKEEADVEVEIITDESDFDALIRQALQQANYRQAVRYQYLRTLHLLAGKNFIELAPDKTNYQYVREIANRNHQNDFAALTLNYEYVWYGEFDIEKNIYQKIETNFTSLNQKL
jgi:large-conductance mechanosensitive channel